MRSLSEKRLRYGTFSTVMMLLAVVLFVLVNLVADEFNFSRDLTQEQFFTLTSQSRQFINELDQDITLIYVVPTGHEHWLLGQLLEEFDAASPRIRVETRDPLLNPTLMHEFAAAAGLDGGIPVGSTGSVIVQNGDQTRVVTELDMLPRDMWGNIQLIRFEAEITRAIHNVTQGEPPVIYFVSGSGEIPVMPLLSAFLQSENYIVRETNLVLNDVPDDADILFITMPNRDWTDVKSTRIQDFLHHDGRAFMALSFFPDELPNFASVMAGFGLRVSDALVLEGDSRQIFMGSPYNVIPTPTAHEILGHTDERAFANLLLFPAAMEVLDVRRASTNIEPIWVTSNDAFARVDRTEATTARIPSDIGGPFNLAVAVTDQFAGYTTQFVAVSSLTIIEDGLNDFIGGGNLHFVLNSLRWLHDQPPGILIPSRRPPGAEPLLIPEFHANVMRGVAMVGLPLGVMLAGVVVWVRRRYS